MNKLKGALKSWTIHWSLLLMAMGAVETYSSYLQPFLKDRFGLFMFAVGVINALLRWKTNQALENK